MLVVIRWAWLAATAYAVVALIRPIPPFRKRRYALAFLAAAQLAVFILIAVVAPPGQTPPEPKSKDTPAPAPQAKPSGPEEAARLKKLGPDVKEVSFSDYYRGSPKERLIQFTILSDSYDGSSYLFTAANEITDISKKMVRQNPDEFTSLRFFLKRPVSDAYGREDVTPTFIIEIPKSELEKVNWDNFSGWDLLNISYVEKKADGGAISDSFCNDKDNSKYATRFCASMAQGDTQEILSNN